MRKGQGETLLEVADAGDALDGAFITRVDERVYTLRPVDRGNSDRQMAVG